MINFLSVQSSERKPLVWIPFMFKSCKNDSNISNIRKGLCDNQSLISWRCKKSMTVSSSIMGLIFDGLKPTHLRDILSVFMHLLDNLQILLALLFSSKKAVKCSNWLILFIHVKSLSNIKERCNMNYCYELKKDSCKQRVWSISISLL